MFNFRDLNLKNIQASTGSAVLPPGRYACKVNEAKLEKTSTGGWQLVVSLVDSAGGGSIKEWMNIHNPNSEDSTRINRERLKALLVHGGHPDPDNIGQFGVESMRGLVVGVAVRSESYKDKTGKDREGTRVHYFFDPKELGDAPAAESGGNRDSFADFKDDIPY